MNYRTTAGAAIEAVRFTDSPSCLMAIVEMAGTPYYVAYEGESSPRITVQGRSASVGDWIVKVPETSLLETLSDAAFRRWFSVAN